MIKKDEIFKIIICQECGKEVPITKVQQRTIRCKECAEVWAADRSRYHAAKTRRKTKAAPKKKLCTCGCGRLKGKTLWMLSDYCYANKDND
ncbi:MAG TPA: hypothetical protein VMV86_06890 [Methanosarcinales archaeon]|nr:hypothetical protein [Methanosarcinales archaeon]